VERITRRLGYGSLRVLAEVHSRDISREEAGLPTRAFLVDRLHISPTEAGRRLRALRDVIPGRSVSGEVLPPGLPTAAAGLADGSLSQEHASVISHALQADGGPTTVENLVLLCDLHHWIVHHEHWHITFIGSIPYVIPPPIIDPQQRPRRNTIHDVPQLVGEH
jgi:hypothetical protein